MNSLSVVSGNDIPESVSGAAGGLLQFALIVDIRQRWFYLLVIAE